ncbi:MAG: UDP-N-acetylmuramoyl-tripeptide--D-alanyl-D-alanine ligase [Lachnospiraceae bacterium]|nr:UDP-N-acetylmuramoyl-tripeptide--D-alanyl-D-alanine ligase [Lachnospiraceae bacterium]
MKNMTLDKIAQVSNGKLFYGKLVPAAKETDGNREVSCVVMDSRKIVPDGLFIANVGAKADGHKFIGQVFESGALCVVCEKTPEQVESEHGIPVEKWGAYILVENSLQALKDIAEYYREQFEIPVVGITGSVGKTSTKEFIAGVLSQKLRVLKTEGNFNNEVGVPLTLLRLREEHEAAVVEMGISDFGEMHRLSKMVKPDICVMTNIGQSHLDHLKSRAGILKAKTEIFDYMSEDGFVCVNGDDDMLASLTEVKGKRVLRFGLTPDGISDREVSGKSGGSCGYHNDVYADEVESRGLFGSSAVMYMDGESIPVEIPLPGQHMVINAMAAALVARLLGLTAGQIAEGIAGVEAVGGRSRIMRLEKLTLIDDCYNANPVSMRSAIDLLETAPDRKVAILGDMLGLGENAECLHAEVGRYAVEKGTDLLLCVGENAVKMYDSALENYDGSQDIRYFATLEELLEDLPGLLLEGDTVLVKASHDMEFHRIVEFLK